MKSLFRQINFALPVRTIVRLFIVCLLLSVSALSQTPSASPVLRLETGMHTASINDIGVDRLDRWMVTTSDDKTARIWDLQTGALVRTLRVPIGAGEEGKLYAVAVSPDGKIIAVGGWTGYEWDETFSVYLFDRQTGRIVRRISNLPNSVGYLTFSPDGMLLAVVTNGEGNGVRVYNTSDYSKFAIDNDCQKQITGLNFDPNSRHLVTASWDGYLRLYTIQSGKLQLVIKKQADGMMPESVNFSPDNSKIVVGFNPGGRDSKKIQVLSANSLNLLYEPKADNSNNFELSEPKWSGDGNILYAIANSISGHKICYWTKRGDGDYGETAIVSTSPISFQPLRTRGVAYRTTAPSWGIIDENGIRTRLINASTIRHYDVNRDFLLSNSGLEIGYNYEIGGNPLAFFSLVERLIHTNKNDDYARLQPDTSRIKDIYSTKIKIDAGEIDLSNANRPKFNGQRMAIDDEAVFGVAIAPNKKQFLFGTNRKLRLFDQTGKELWNTTPVDAVWSVNISGDGRLAVAAYDDGTIRWYRMMDGQELLAFFPHNDKKRWVMWTPTGYYDASPDAEDLIGWHVNNGKDAAADFFPVGQFRSQFYRPDVIDLVLKTLDETTALQQANEAAGRKQQTADISKQLPPVVEIVSPRDGTEVSNSLVKIGYNIRTSSGEPVTNIKVLVDGRPVAQDRGASNRPTGGAAEITVTIPEKDSEVAIIAENRFAPSVPAIVKLKWKGKTQVAADEFIVKPKLYILAVGVSKYANADYNLDYAAKDAKDFAAAMQAQQGGIYREVVVKSLTDADATRDNIVDGLDWIRLQTTSKDVAMIFMAGHGTNDTLNRYYFLPHNFNADRLASTGVTFTDIKNSVEAIAGKAVFFVDTCHSGNVLGTTKSRGLPDINGFVNELSSAENGAIVFAASTGKQVSLEDDSWNNGAFTKALVEGLSGKAQIPGKGKITINSLDLYISERVKELTKGQQTPTTSKPDTVPDFPVAAAKY